MRLPDQFRWLEWPLTDWVEWNSGDNSRLGPYSWGACRPVVNILHRMEKEMRVGASHSFGVCVPIPVSMPASVELRLKPSIWQSRSQTTKANESRQPPRSHQLLPFSTAGVMAGRSEAYADVGGARKPGQADRSATDKRDCRGSA